jgi:hypothetical protein
LRGAIATTCPPKLNERRRKQSILSTRHDGLLRSARNDDPILFHRAFARAARTISIGQGLEATFRSNIAKADAKAEALEIDLSVSRTLGAPETATSLTTLSEVMAGRACEHLATLNSVIASDFDVTDAKMRARMRVAVTEARVILNQGAKGIAEFDAWTALKQAKDDASFRNTGRIASEAHAELAIATTWHVRQQSDQKLRLKALAAHYYIAPHGGDELGLCPLCEAQLSSASQKALQAELAELKTHADLAERKLVDVCATVKQRIAAVLTPELRKHYEALIRMIPKEAYGSAARARFAEEEPSNPYWSESQPLAARRSSTRRHHCPTSAFRSLILRRRCQPRPWKWAARSMNWNASPHW